MLKSYGGWWVAYSILVSAQGPLVLSLGPRLDNKTLFHDDGFHGCVEIWPRYFLTVFYLASALHVSTEPVGGDID